MSISSYFFADFKKVAVYETINIDNKEVVKKKIQLVDQQTLERYRYEPAFDAIARISLVFLLNPIVMLSKMIFNTVQIGYDFTKSYLFSSLNMLDDFRHGRVIKIFEEYVVSKIILFKFVVEDIINIVKAPFFAIAIQFACLTAVVSPNNAKKLIAKIEKRWNMNQDASHDFRNSQEFKSRNVLGFISNLFNRRDDMFFYLAARFHPLGTLKDKNIKTY